MVRRRPRSGASPGSPKTSPTAGTARGALEALGAVSVRAYWDQLDDKTRQHVSAFVERLAVPADDPLRLIALGLIDPIHRGPEVIARVARMSPVDLSGPDDSMAVGRAAMAVWADNLALPFLRSAVAGYRSDGRLARLAQGLMYEAWAEHQLRRSPQRVHRCGRGGKARRGSAPAPFRARRESCPCHRRRGASRG